MRSRILCTAALAALIAGASPVWAQQTNPAGTQANPVGAKKPTAAERERARVTVQKRSFLDAGVEVKPGQRKFTDYAFPPGYSPTATTDFTSGNIRGPLIGGTWDTSRNNFWPW